MTALYNGMTREALDASYNNSAAVLNSAVLMAEFDERSAKLRAAQRLPDPLGREGPNRLWIKCRDDFFHGQLAAPLRHQQIGLHIDAAQP